ncbi:MAG: vitamin B12-dependent ribonucleotide reductase, partial [Acidimicrobiaceae bacterium]|nr:vitamin B12-dependent ribonucleotide reductase [Acidimicrobiaceae bacterium]
HIEMMAAVQPFLSGAISKTVNMPADASVDDVEQLFIDSWRLGLKSVAIYRDSSKVSQPLTVGTAEGPARTPDIEPSAGEAPAEPVRRRLPKSRRSQTFEFRVADCKGFVTVGEYPDGRPGEIFVKVSKQGSTLAGIMDAFAISLSHGLQYGVPLSAFVDTFVGVRFEPAGITDDPDIRIATSLMDYLFRKLAVMYLTSEERAALGVYTTGERTQPTLPGVEEQVAETEQGHDLPPDPPSVPSPGQLIGQFDFSAASAPPEPPGPERPASAASMSGGQATARGASPLDAPFCMTCGVPMRRAGSCYVCNDCGATSGCS